MIVVYQGSQEEGTNSLEDVIVVCISWKNIVPFVLLQFGQCVYAEMRRQNIKLVSSKLHLGYCTTNQRITIFRIISREIYTFRSGYEGDRNPLLVVLVI